MGKTGIDLGGERPAIMGVIEQSDGTLQSLKSWELQLFHLYRL
jgi:hypothetical protein